MLEKRVIAVSEELRCLYDESVASRLLGEINALRVAEAPARYYYGVIKPAFTSGGTGLGYLGLPAAIALGCFRKNGQER